LKAQPPLQAYIFPLIQKETCQEEKSSLLEKDIYLYVCINIILQITASGLVIWKLRAFSQQNYNLSKILENSLDNSYIFMFSQVCSSDCKINYEIIFFSGPPQVS
jgi:hypothetical protein